MKHIGSIKKDTLVSIMNWIGIPLIISYLFCMIIFPFFAGWGNWDYVQKVWDRWQTINTGFLALISSIIAFNISKFSENQQRQRQFLAARSFLPHALSELTTYCRDSSGILREALNRTTEEDSERETPLSSKAPDLPIDYKDIFRQCITFAESNVADNLANILVLLQVNNSRLKNLENSFSPNSHTVLAQINIMTYIFKLGEIQAIINKIFDFSRGENDFDDSSLIWDDYRNAYSNLDFRIGTINGLEEFTKRAILAKTNINVK